MAQRKLNDVKIKALQLPPDKQVELAEFLLSRQESIQIKPATDLNSFSGTLNPSIDPLDYQRSIRAEWGD